jgi:hypothetical protein
MDGWMTTTRCRTPDDDAAREDDDDDRRRGREGNMGPADAGKCSNVDVRARTTERRGGERLRGREGISRLSRLVRRRGARGETDDGDSWTQSSKLKVKTTSRPLPRCPDESLGFGTVRANAQKLCREETRETRRRRTRREVFRD